MKTREIPREQWNNLFLMLTRELTGEPVRLEVVGKELGDQPMAEQVPLREVVLDKRGRGGREIDVMVGRDEDPFDHYIATPRSVAIQESDEGEVRCLDIEDTEGIKTLIHFVNPARASKAVEQAQPPGP